METKSTNDLLAELEHCEDFTRFYRENGDAMVSDLLSAMLEKLLAESGRTKAEAIRLSEMSEVYAYQIFSGKRAPDRKKLLALAFGMGLDLDKTQKLLKCAGYPPLYIKLPFDCAVIYGLCKKLSVVETNGILFSLGEETVG
ncbi:MAG: helix-turn-helix transcriptional regulator [Clostridia bacterium]|nr:helix-turn-helix transcriptional regulator [Clostridia bacterium]